MKKKLTERQKKLIKLISENFRSETETKTMKQMMLEAGYSESTALQQATILAGIQEETDPIVEKLKEIRQQAIDAIPSKLDKATYRDMVDAIDKMTKNAQLISGKSTENQALTIKWDE